MANKSTLKRKATRQRAKARNMDTGNTNLVVSNIPRNYLRDHVSGVSQSLRRTLAWAVSTGISSTVAGTYTELSVTILNGAYDPDAALGGTQPAGFAKYMQLYSKCFVTQARMKVRGRISGAGFAGPPTNTFVIGAAITTSSSAIAGIDQAIYCGLSQYDVVNVNPDKFNFDLSVDVAKFVDKPFILDDPQFFCTTGANPSQVIAGHIWYYNNGVLTTSTISYVIEVEMDCTFTDPIPFV
jgi:hypothetical protein